MVKSFGGKKKSTTGSVIGHPDEEGLTKEQHPLNRILDEKAEGKSIYNFKKGKLRTGKARLLRLRLASVFSAAKKKDEDKKVDIESEKIRKSVYGKKKEQLDHHVKNKYDWDEIKRESYAEPDDYELEEAEDHNFDDEDQI